MFAGHAEEAYVYHEQQQSALCARHCLNNLLQGPFFTEFNLSQIGHLSPLFVFWYQKSEKE